MSGKTLLAVQAPPDSELLVPQPELDHSNTVSLVVLVISDTWASLKPSVNLFHKLCMLANKYL